MIDEGGVFALYVGNVSGNLVNKLAVAVLIARVAQSLVHVCLVQSNLVASIRFAFSSCRSSRSSG